jgi:ribosomal protein L30/L7E
MVTMTTQELLTLLGGKIISPHRRFVKEGELMEHSAKGSQVPIHIFLFNDTLLFARPQRKKTIPPKYKYLRLHRLNDMVVKDNLPNTSEYNSTVYALALLIDY